MMKYAAVTSTALFMLLCGCSGRPADLVEIRQYPIFSLEEMISKSDLVLDEDNSHDRNGSAKIVFDKDKTVALFETGSLDMAGGSLVCQAWLCTEKLEGSVSLFLSGSLPGRGGFMLKMPEPISSASDWCQKELTLDLKTGEKPDNIRIGIIAAGKGTVWVDDIRLYKKAKP